jgi:hypothetical protein
MNCDPDLLLVQSDVSDVYDAPFSPNYNIQSKIDDSEHIVTAYTSDMRIDDGWVTFDIQSKKRKLRSVGRPYHFITPDGILLALKRHKHQVTDSFALNHELFALANWHVSIILHFEDGGAYLFVATRDEWLETGFVSPLGEELQVSVRVPNHRMVPWSVLTGGWTWWIDECKKAVL